MSYCTAMWFVFVSPSEHNKVCSLTAFGWFAVLGLFGLGLVEVGLYFGIERYSLNYVIARLLSAPITVIWNFASRKFVLARAMPNKM